MNETHTAASLQITNKQPASVMTLSKFSKVNIWFQAYYPFNFYCSLGMLNPNSEDCDLWMESGPLLKGMHLHIMLNYHFFHKVSCHLQFPLQPHKK